ncbi:MAG: CoB--CoM heterodisulfide reductase iron-sulfur subunit B family protein [Syntrophobacteraceae bacterium]
MKLVFFPCCISSAFLDRYESTTQTVLAELGIAVHSSKEFNCCGYPLKGCNYSAYIHLAAKNLAIAESKGVRLLTPCGCCFGSLKHVESLLRGNAALRADVNKALAKEGLQYSGTAKVKHVLEILLEDVGIENLKARIDRKHKGLKIATHYGCHLLRPREIVNFDNPFRPVKFDQLVEVTGAESVDWSEKLECCGAPLLGVNRPLSMSLTRTKLGSAKRAGADYICSACPCCHIQIEKVREELLAEHGVIFRLPSITYLQLLGICLGVDERDLGLNERDPVDLNALCAIRHLRGGPEALRGAHARV